MAKTPEDLDAVYRALKSLLVEYETPRPGVVLEGRSASGNDFDLWSVRNLVIDGRPRREVFLAGIRRQKAFVGFYYLPVYGEPALGAKLAPSLLKLLKGKSCFHVKALDGGLLDAIRAALDLGVDAYRQRGWV
jgi:hypothetical protein